MGQTLDQAADVLDPLVRGLRGRKVAVLGHMRPDGDCIGSQTALCRILMALGADARCVNRHRVPPNLVSYADGVRYDTEEGFGRRDNEVAVAVDCADLSRIGSHLTDPFGGLEGNIDHHVSNNGFAKVNAVVDISQHTE